MRALWLLNFGLLFALTDSKTDTKNAAGELPPKVAIPGCEDPATTKAPLPDDPRYYGVTIDKDGCQRKVLGSSQRQQRQVQNGRKPGRKGRGRRPVFVDLKLTVDCKRKCNGTYSQLPDGEPCLVCDGEPYGRHRTIKGGCYQGNCSSGQCHRGERKVNCYIPKNITNNVLNSVNLAE
uniref:Evasin n=1 Tax=Amblyomma parvum TaxID=251391 RepID=A0A023FXU4_AMBPA